ncbi:hypothetical protein [Staphylococcus equorum]|uniref:Uncharacterized protein n=1 Tax=Staphylococcus equorum TaxID=246432 RepID=A0AAP7IG20_9STAP|nr:hypothetical protein [Staphylococcus equorum]OEK58926.1 hypothetical protein ASS94_00965 [Staphylococcus equorum]
MNKVTLKEVKDAFELEEAELCYRYKQAKGLDKSTVVLIRPTQKENYESWVDMYNESNTDQDIYDFIISQFKDEAIRILEGKEREDFLDKNPTLDYAYQYTSECIKKVLDYNNVELINVTPYNIAVIMEDEMIAHGSVKGYLLNDEFISDLVKKGFVKLTLKTPDEWVNI